MKLKVLFFSVLRECTGCDDLFFDIDREGMTIDDVLQRLSAQFPKLKDWDKQVLLALDQAYVERSKPVSGGQELAIMPPVQGG